MAKEKDKAFVAQKAILYREDGTVLALLRGKTAPIFPLYWDLAGGVLDYGEQCIDCVAREVEEETGISDVSFEHLDVLSVVNPNDVFWVINCWYAKVPLEQEVTLSFEHVDYEWLPVNEFLKLDVTHENREFLQTFKKLQKHL